MATTAAAAAAIDLAPLLAERLRRLLAEVSTTTTPPLVIDLTYRGPRCVVCYRPGKLGGHYGDGRIEWIHRGCHRHLHRRRLLSRSERDRLRQRDRRYLAAA